MRKPLLFAIALVTAAAHSPLSSQEGIELDASGAELRLRGPAPRIRFFKEAGPIFPATSHSISGAVDLDGNSTSACS